uniref:Centromere protein J n=1 Tax=Anabas testudineus TaxID=64144 RepID=A0A7N6AM66_ANATE
MSSPAGHQHSQADFLARWMPSSTRAGVILNPCPDLASSLQHISAVGSVSLEPDDSFVSDFAPLPASADSSCLGVDGFAQSPGGERTGTDRPVTGLCSVSTRISSGQVDSLDKMASETQSMPLTMKLEQLRKWQQHMQEQLKAHQLEELLRLQEEQQKLLGMINASQHYIDDTSELSGAEWEEESIQGPSHHQENPHSPTINCYGVPQGSKCVLRQAHLSGGLEGIPRDHKVHKEMDDKEDSVWNSTGDDQEQSDDTLQPSSGLPITEGNRGNDKVLNDRPIQPGIGGQKLTFEELLEEQLRLEEQRLKSAQKQSQDGAQVVQAIPKRAFLKRGEGLSRFTNKCKANLPKIEGKKDSKPQPQARVISRSNSEPASFQKSVINGVQGLPVQRKTAILNKENQQRGLCSSPQDIKVDGKTGRTKVLGSHQRQNTAGPVSIQIGSEDRQSKQLGKGKEPTKRKVGSFAQSVKKPVLHNNQPNPVTKQVGVLGGPEKTEHDPAKDKSCGSREGSTGSEGGDGVPQDSFELSFQEKLQHWECDRHLESMELGEFELLEQAAEELSFSSNSSFVMKVLQMDQQHKQLQAAKGLHQRRLSSTPIKSPPMGAVRMCSSVDNCGGLASQSSSVNSEAFVVKRREDTLKSKVSSEVKEGQGSGKEDTHQSSEFEDREVVVKPLLIPGTLFFPAQSNPPYDKRSYQDEDSCKDSASDVTQDDDDEGERDSVTSNTEESTLIEDKEQQGRVVFDDDDTWNDLEDTTVNSKVASPVSPKTTVSGATLTERTLLRKVAVSKVVEMDRLTVTGSANLEPDPPPPASQLMTRLFPSLKPRTQNPPLPPSPPPDTSVLRERLVELEIEIERFKKENAALTKLRQENEKIQGNLRKERLDFEQMKVEELAKFEEYKKEENRKLQKERKLFEKHASAARAIPDKKEREEIQALKQQVSSLEEELRRKESRWASTHSRQRQQIDSLNQENSSLRDEVRTLEKLRLSAWKKNPVSAEKDIKDGPKMFENSLSAGTKGVKFAVSMFVPFVLGYIVHVARIHFHFKFFVTEKVLAGGDRLIIFPNGTRKEISADGQTVKVTFFNGDTKQITADQRVIYYYADAQTTHITYPDGMEVLHFPNNQTEKHFPDGHKEITFPDQTVKNLFPDGREESVLTDGTIIQVNPDGTKEILFNTGQKEIHTADYKRREYPDGTVKTVYTDGRQETRYPNGRLRVKDKDGNVVLDNRA